MGKDGEVGRSPSLSVIRSHEDERREELEVERYRKSLIPWV